ncbi:type VI secretion system protein TssA [Pararhodobacter sp. SW119]|uniref:type VI secretion system protein TssA n=1 Tax=Pararhodobacter sp. SW119 TaxID=2780075 RepID=UPI001ADF6A2E|nr:type VI secretion system protein TssA [Pararhodobacter sp. SW119]
MDLEALLAPREGNPPSGENLEYEDVFVAMEIAARPVEERQAGDEILEGADPDYGDLRIKALAVMAQSHDLRAGVALSGALLFTEGLTGFAQGTAYVRGCLERHWESCHPQLDAEDDDDPTMRINSLQSLAEPGRILRGLRTAPLSDSRAFGKVTLRDIQIATGQIALPEGESPFFDNASIAAAFRDTDSDSLTETLAGARAAKENLQAIDGIFNERTPGQGPQLSEPIRLLQQIEQHLAAAAGVEVAGADEAGAEDAPGGGAAPVRGAPGSIASTADVRSAMDAIIAYYQKNEPSSPVPMLVERAKRLVGADFMVIVKELAPQGVDNVRLVGGIPDEDY